MAFLYLAASSAGRKLVLRHSLDSDPPNVIRHLFMFYIYLIFDVSNLGFDSTQQDSIHPLIVTVNKIYEVYDPCNLKQPPRPRYGKPRASPKTQGTSNPGPHPHFELLANIMGILPQ